MKFDIEIRVDCIVQMAIEADTLFDAEQEAKRLVDSQDLVFDDVIIESCELENLSESEE